LVKKATLFGEKKQKEAKLFQKALLLIFASNIIGRVLLFIFF